MSWKNACSFEVELRAEQGICDQMCLGVLGCVGSWGEMSSELR